MTPEMNLIFKYSDKLLEVFENRDDMDFGDFTGAIMAQLKQLIEEAKYLPELERLAEDDERCPDCGHKPCDGGSFYCKMD